jgi:hypothetical protein
MLRLKFFFQIIIFLFITWACCDEPPSLVDASLKFKLVDKITNVNLFRFGSTQIPEYNKDTIKLFNQDLQQIDLEKIEESFFSYSFLIKYIYKDGEDESAFNMEKCKRYYLYLNQNDTDTLDICFTAENLRCKGQGFKEFKVFYNAKLIPQNQQESAFDINIKK